MTMLQAGINQDNSRIHNRGLILKLIKQHPGITRSGLAVESGLSKSAITKIMTDFLTLGVIMEDKSGSSRNKGLDFKENLFYIISIYFSRVSITGAVYDVSGRLVLREQLPKGITFYGNDNLTYDTKGLIDLLIQKSGLSRDKILAVGIAAPGGVRFRARGVYSSPVYSSGINNNIPFNWNKINLVEYLEELTGFPVFLENDSNLCALAESWFGKGLDVENFVQYSIGLGIGAGAVMDGRIVTGNKDVILEIGHTSVNLNGVLCFCGNRGCLETEAGFRKIVEVYDAGESVIDDDRLIERIGEIFQKAAENEERAVKVLRDHSYRIASGAVTLINMLSPDKLVISPNDIDGIPIDYLMRDIEFFIKKHVFPVLANNVQIELSGLGSNIHLLGAFALILENLYSLLLPRIEENLFSF